MMRLLGTEEWWKHCIAFKGRASPGPPINYPPKPFPLSFIINILSSLPSQSTSHPFSHPSFRPCQQTKHVTYITKKMATTSNDGDITVPKAKVEEDPIVIPELGNRRSQTVQIHAPPTPASLSPESVIQQPALDDSQPQVIDAVPEDEKTKDGSGPE
jgi:hypothetical protein